ncbi:MAG: hypothetical protein JWN65_350 [Solirubrobacterales bacterium]|nr:hypothetical protein [Solirubrobacterales bacterium]
MADLRRREPMPDLSALPGWVWRRLGPGGRLALALTLLGLIAVLAVAIPAIDADKRQARAQERVRDARARAMEDMRLRHVQRPHRAAMTAGTTLTAARTEVQAHITHDVRRRQATGELQPVPAVRATSCRPVTTAGAVRYRAAGVDHLRCLAMTSENAAVAVGYEFIAATSPATGRMVWCKTTALPGEKLNAISQATVEIHPGCYRP